MWSGLCSPCSCHPQPAAYHNASHPQFAKMASETIAVAGCYNSNEAAEMIAFIAGTMPFVGSPSVMELAEACDPSSNTACNSGYCQSQGYSLFHPAFTYEPGCYTWHGGSDQPRRGPCVPRPRKLLV